MLGLGKAETPYCVAGAQFEQPAVFLVVAAVRVDRVHDERALDAGHRPQPGVTRF